MIGRFLKSAERVSDFPPGSTLSVDTTGLDFTVSIVRDMMRLRPIGGFCVTTEVGQGDHRVAISVEVRTVTSQEDAA